AGGRPHRIRSPVDGPPGQVPLIPSGGQGALPLDLGGPPRRLEGNPHSLPRFHPPPRGPSPLPVQRDERSGHRPQLVPGSHPAPGGRPQRASLCLRIAPLRQILSAPDVLLGRSPVSFGPRPLLP